jgi:hypothetical protein
MNRMDLDSVVIAPARFTPKSNFEAFSIGKIKGGAKGATIGAGLGVAHVAAFAALGGPLAVILAPYLLVIEVPVMAAAGGAVGFIESLPVEDARAVEALIEHNLKELNIQPTLAKLVAESASNDTGHILPINEGIGPAAPDAKGAYGEQEQRGLRGVLEIGATEIGFENETENLRFYLVVRVRMIRSGDGEQLYEREFVYTSDPYVAQYWAAHKAALFEAEMQRAYASVSESIVEQVFLLTALPLENKYRDPDQRTQGIFPIGGEQACGLAWRQPPHDYYPTITGDTADWNRFPVLVTRQPTLEWESFPRVIDRQTRYAHLLNTVTNIRYDLRIWQTINNAPPQIVYERRALTVPTHALDHPLAPATRHFWSIRARFEVNGRTQAIRWGCYRTPMYDVAGSSKHIKPQASPSVLLGGFLRDPCNLDFIPTANYYRFQTP